MTRSAPRTGITSSMTKTINAPRERVFAAWTQPDLPREWWGAHESFSAPAAEADPRVGGKYRLGMLEPGKDAPTSATASNGRWTRRRSWPSPGPGSRCRAATPALSPPRHWSPRSLSTSKFPGEHTRDERQGGWGGCLDGLERLFEKRG